MPAAIASRQPTTFPALRRHRPLAIAHRGGAWEAPENSAEAFAAAYALGYRYFETDARATSDGVAVAFHDAYLSRVTDADSLIRETTWQDVRRAQIHGHARIMRLDDLIADYPDVVFNVDIKERAAIEPFISVVRRTQCVDRVVLASFSHNRLQAVREALGPRAASSLSPREVAAIRLSADGRPAPRLPRWAACAQVPERFGGRVVVDDAFVALCHRLALQVHVWTINETDAIDRLLELEVDGIMTDRPTVLKSHLQSRGAWNEPQ